VQSGARGSAGRISNEDFGHKTRSVFDRYAIVSADNITNAMRRLEVAALGVQPVWCKITENYPTSIT